MRCCRQETCAPPPPHTYPHCSLANQMISEEGACIVVHARNPLRVILKALLWSAPCSHGSLLQVRSLGFLSEAWTLAEAGDATPCKPCKRSVQALALRVATVFWDAAGRAITEDRKLRASLPGADTEGAPISDELVEEEMKWVYKYSRLHTVASVQRYFDMIPGSGTLILLWPLPDPASKKQVNRD